MSKILLMITTIILFAIAAVVGITLIVPVIKGEKPARTNVFVHGAVAATALVMLIIKYLDGRSSALQVSVILFVVAALGGLVLFTRDLQQKSLPPALALLHAGVAVAAFLILLFSIF